MAPFWQPFQPGQEQTGAFACDIGAPMVGNIRASKRGEEGREPSSRLKSFRLLLSLTSADWPDLMKAKAKANERPPSRLARGSGNIY